MGVLLCSADLEPVARATWRSGRAIVSHERRDSISPSIPEPAPPSSLQCARLETPLLLPLLRGLTAWALLVFGWLGDALAPFASIMCWPTTAASPVRSRVPQCLFRTVRRCVCLSCQHHFLATTTTSPVKPCAAE